MRGSTARRAKRIGCGAASLAVVLVAAGGDLEHDQAGHDFSPGCEVGDSGCQVDMATEQVT